MFRKVRIEDVEDLITCCDCGVTLDRVYIKKERDEQYGGRVDVFVCPVCNDKAEVY